MSLVFLRRFPSTALGASIALLLAGCEMPTASLTQGPGAKTEAVAATPGTGAATTASPSTSPSAGAASGGPTTGPAASHPLPVGATTGVDIPTPSTGFQPPTPGLPGSGFAPTSPPATSGGPSASGSRVEVQLSAGVALAQTLPDGTGMLFSIDYRFSGSRPDQSTKYFWVITCQNGRPSRQEVQVKDTGTLQAVARGMRPEVGPFHCHLEAQSRGASQATVISNQARMISDNVPR